MKKARGQNADRHQCQTCLFKAPKTTLGNGCDYIVITGHSRGCSVEDCDVYQEKCGRRKKQSYRLRKK